MKPQKYANLLLLTTALLMLVGCSSREIKESGQSRILKDDDAVTKSAEPFFIFRDHQPMASIMVDDAATPPPERRFCDHYVVRIPEMVPSDVAKAVELFRRDVRVGYGVDLPLGADAKLPNRIEIVVEKRPLMTEDETTIDFPSANVMRVTGGESGIIRTLFYLLEEFGGARYLFQGATGNIGIGAHFPKRTTLAIPRESFNRSSAFPLNRSSGQTTYGASWPNNRNRVYWWSWEARLGTKSRIAFSHYLTKVAFPIDQYMRSEKKPNEEMFPIRNGKRVKPWEWGANLDAGYTSRKYRHGWQPRYSSQAAVDEAAKNLLAYLRKNPGVRSLSLAVNDSGGHCETEIDPKFPVRNNPRLIAAYYGWVNAVVERVTAEFPDIIFGVIAYSTVEQPPNFKLHPNVVVVICFDTQACIDPEVRKMRRKLVRDWSKLATIGTYSYDYGDQFYSLPRLYLREMRDMVRYYRDHGAVFAISERAYNTATEGPKMYVLFKLWENPDLDMEATILDWCQAAVGPEAAPHLRDYYAFWEDFWREKAVHTKWWSSKSSVYLSLGKLGNYMYALEPGDMARFRALMKQVVKLAEAHGTEDQPRRARLLMAGFEWYEACAVACGAEYFAADGKIPTAAAAVALLRDIPKAVNAYQTVRSLPHKMKNDWVVAKSTADWGMSDPVPSSLIAAAAWLSDPKVQKEFKALAENPDLDASLRLMARATASAGGGDDADNLLVNGSLESPKGAVGSGESAHHLSRGVEGWETWSPVHGSVSRTNKMAASGEYSLKCDIPHGNFRALRIIEKARPNTQYLFAAKIFIPKDQPVQEGRIIIRGSPTISRGQEYYNRGHTPNIQNIIPKAGEWNYVSCIIPSTKHMDSLRLRIDLSGFERGDVAYIDDVQVLELADPEVK